ncbi:MAG: type II CRISPR-associated endonuclease Cas1 [Chthoniobacterales bacterium]|nr:type II CRISPR-associated endonuclease Cas1 [Chthoniobacterales bacterium]
MERQQLVCLTPEGNRRRLPVQDLRAVVVAARGVSFSAEAMSAILDADAVILHSNARYKPCGLSVPLFRVASHEAFLGQIHHRAGFNDRLWRIILVGKLANQAACLRLLGIPSAFLENASQSKCPHEGNCARHYWRRLFSSLGWPRLRRREQRDEPSPNHMLNYGYAVISALCHRSLLVHGLQPAIGLHHRSRYRAIPLVHDFVEPFRAFVDSAMAAHIRTHGTDMSSWARSVAQALRNHRIQHGPGSMKLMDAIDKAASSLARAYAKHDATELWLPVMGAPA